MRRDKALLPFCGTPLIHIAVTKLRTFCCDVSILGSRDDLSAYAPVVHDLRNGIGPAAAFEAALRASKRAWNLFIPVDVPLVPAEILKRWASEVLDESFCGTSFLIVGQDRQPAFSMLHAKCADSISRALDRGDRRLNDLLDAPDADDVGSACPKNVTRFARGATVSQLEFWFSNINTPQELADAEAWAQSEGWRPPALV